MITTSNWQDIAIKYIDQLKFKSPKNLQWLPSRIFDDKLLKDLQKDSIVLEKLIKKFGVWDESKDSKLESLYDLITKTHPTQKILVFTEFA